MKPGTDQDSPFSSKVTQTAEEKPRLNPDEVAQIYRELGAEISAFLTGLLRSSELAAEALQTTFQRLLESGKEARSETLRGWLFKVAYHEAMALRRRQGIDQRATVKVQEQQSVRQRLQNTSPQVSRMIAEEDVVRLKEGLSALPPEQRWVVERRIYHDETFAMIAEQLGVPLGTVLTRMRLALQKLQRNLSREFPEW